ncbi:SPOSA6832_00160 [Sporobolomyces salmonicolor]|uniref:SPOSA6832_00160-mRNA-1:cds n=1 Tax=Sporidiobolus salmonicolor TaxID=5005 RepID=A0A0D6EFC6_SPOSA|nr:SPOSA6832_00160 [Sporobolomyces salmonicolor]
MSTAKKRSKRSDDKQPSNGSRDAWAATSARDDPSVRRIPLLNRKLSQADGPDLDPKVKLDEVTGRLSLDAPSTPYHELDLSDSFLAALNSKPLEPKKTWGKKRRLYFLLGGLLGLFSGWLFTEGDPLASLASLDLDSFTSFDLQALIADMPSLGALNVTEMLAPGREWLNSRTTNFEVGRDAKDRGLHKKHAVVLVPGIVSSGLESWSTSPDAAGFFRKRIWASTSMLRAIMTSKEAWVRAMSLDPFTGIDPDGYKVRAAQGLDAATAFMPGYWIWQKVIENLAVLNYDHDDLLLAAYDWRLAYYNLEVRDRYFSRLKAAIEFNLAINEKKTVLVSHSMGSSVILWFFKCVPDLPSTQENLPLTLLSAATDGSNPPITAKAAPIGSTGTYPTGSTLLALSSARVPKAMSALLSGEMRDTVEVNVAGAYLLERFFSRTERAKLFRSWAGASFSPNIRTELAGKNPLLRELACEQASMMLKGGNAVWGDENGAPDDPPNATLTGGRLYYFRPEEKSNTSEVSASTVYPNLTLDDANSFILEKVPPSYQQMLASNFSFGIERDEEQLIKNNDDHRKWSNPLEVQLPKAPNMTIYCCASGSSGSGPLCTAMARRRSEHTSTSKASGYEHDESPTFSTDPNQPTCLDPNCTDSTPRAPLDLPLSRKVWIDGSVTMAEDHEPKTRSGVVFGQGDGTVSLLSLGSMCVEGWQKPLYNPGGVKVVTHEILHAPLAFDPRGGPTTADHVRLSELNDAILEIVSGHGDNVHEKFHSNIREYAKKIRWDGE